MAISTLDSPAPAAELPLAVEDEPEERTLMAIPATPEAPPPVYAAPPQDAVLRAAGADPGGARRAHADGDSGDSGSATPGVRGAATGIRVRAAPSDDGGARGADRPRPPAHHPGQPARGSAGANRERGAGVPASDSREPATFVGQDNDVYAAPEETRASGTFAGQEPSITAATVPAAPQARLSPVPPPPPMLATLDPGPLPGAAPLLAPEPPPDADVEGESTQQLPPDLVASFNQPAPNGPVTVVAKVEPSSAADKARQRRQLGKTLSGRFMLFWQRQSLPKRIGMASVAVVGVLAGLTLLAALAMPSAIRLPGREPFKLSMEPVPDSFGLGSGVRWVHADDKLFDFALRVPHARRGGPALPGE